MPILAKVFLDKPDILAVAKLWPPYLQSLQESFVVHELAPLRAHFAGQSVLSPVAA